MKQLTYEQAAGMLRLQNDLNLLIDGDWKNKKHPYLRAAWIEAGEFVEHIGWKWWKSQHANLPQADIELVDIWHFMLSEWLQNVPNDETIDDAAALLIDVMYSEEKGGANQVDKLQKYTDILQLTDAFVHLCSANVFNANIFERMLELTASNWDNLYKLYVSKNVLNIFRQTHGYKDGTYIKVWNGEEDNVILDRLFQQHADQTPEELLERLDFAYIAETVRLSNSSEGSAP